MYWQELVDRLQFDHDLPANHEVEPRFSNHDIPVATLDRGLSYERDLPVTQLHTQSLLINTLKKSRAEPPMHLNRGSNHRSGQGTQRFGRLIH